MEAVFSGEKIDKFRKRLATVFLDLESVMSVLKERLQLQDDNVFLESVEQVQDLIAMADMAQEIWTKSDAVGSPVNRQVIRTISRPQATRSRLYARNLTEKAISRRKRSQESPQSTIVQLPCGENPKDRLRIEAPSAP